MRENGSGRGAIYAKRGWCGTKERKSLLNKAVGILGILALVSWGVNREGDAYTVKKVLGICQIKKKDVIPPTFICHMPSLFRAYPLFLSPINNRAYFSLFRKIGSTAVVRTRARNSAAQYARTTAISAAMSENGRKGQVMLAAKYAQ